MNIKNKISKYDKNKFSIKEYSDYIKQKELLKEFHNTTRKTKNMIRYVSYDDFSKTLQEDIKIFCKEKHIKQEVITEKFICCNTDKEIEDCLLIESFKLKIMPSNYYFPFENSAEYCNLNSIQMQKRKFDIDYIFNKYEHLIKRATPYSHYILKNDEPEYYKENTDYMIVDYITEGKLYYTISFYFKYNNILQNLYEKFNALYFTTYSNKDVLSKELKYITSEILHYTFFIYLIEKLRERRTNN